MILVVVFQLAVYLLTLSAGGIFNTVKNDTMYNFSEKVKTRRQYLSGDMVGRWSNLHSTYSTVVDILEEYLKENGYTPNDIKENAKLNEQLVEAVSEEILNLLCTNETTGAFIVLDGAGIQGYPTTYAGLYLRDHDPSNHNDDNSDVLMERGLSVVSRDMGISLDRYWSAVYSFGDPTDKNAAFFFKPLNAAKEHISDNTGENFGYWSRDFILSPPSDATVMTYSLPLIGADGTIYGVIGVELATGYLEKLLPYSEVSYGGDGMYVLGITNDNGKTITPVVTSGPAYGTFFSNSEKIFPTSSGYPGVATIKKDDSYTLFSGVEELKLYNSNTVFSDDVWVLMGICREQDILGFFTDFSKHLGFATIFALVVGIIAAYIVSRNTINPIILMVKELKASNPNKRISLSNTNIFELDSLRTAIEDLSILVAQSSSRISKIIDMTGIPVGVFESSENDDLVFCSGNLLKILNCEIVSQEDQYLEKKVFLEIMSTLHNYVYNAEEKVFKLDGAEWLQLKLYTEKGKTVGAIVDITRDVLEKQKLEYERDYDILTDIYNRRAFGTHIERLFEGKNVGAKLKTAALVMLDLDNLKYTNDQFGHDMGDKYIQALARCIKPLCSSKALVGRRSGDEFYMFLYGYDSKEEIEAILKNLWEDFDQYGIVLPNNDKLKLRASGGVAWYPDDADNIKDLLRFADFAMYSAKNYLKGSLQQFNTEVYKNDEVLYSGEEALNQLVEQAQVKYAFQPIVAVNDGTVYGYEMLMRPQSSQLTNVSEVLRVARAQSKSGQIERLTWFCALNTFSEQVRNGGIPKGIRVFINSIPGQILPREQIQELEKLYSDTLHSVVLEITEDEKDNRDYTAEKLSVIHTWGGLVAIDDFGSGYNGENMLVYTEPNIIKIDIGLVRDIDSDENRQRLIKNIIFYAKERNIKILAEGVETKSEMCVLVKMGVDFLQGYYLSKPELTVPVIPKHIINSVIDAAKDAGL
ncbi:MAG: EAL domain-containing protein [Oscillospiraceae bacterium]